MYKKGGIVFIIPYTTFLLTFAAPVMSWTVVQKCQSDQKLGNGTWFPGSWLWHDNRLWIYGYILQSYCFGMIIVSGYMVIYYNHAVLA